MPQWKYNLYTCVVIQVLVTATFHVVTPFLPFFIFQLGITGSQDVQRWSGILVAVNSFFTGLLSPFWGSLADRYGRKPMLIRSAASIALFTFLTSLSANVYHVLVFRILQGAFSGFAPAALSLLATTVPEKHLSYSLGLMQAGQVLGYLLGPLLGGILSDLFPYRRVFQLGSLMAVTATLLAVFVIQEPSRPEKQKEVRENGFFLSLSWPLTIWVMFTVILLSQFATRGVEPVLPLYVQRMLGPSPVLNTYAGVAVAVQGITSFIGAAVMGYLAPRWGYKRLLVVNLCSSALLYIPQALITNIWSLIFLRFVQGFFLGGLLPCANSLIALFTPAEKRGSVYGLTSSAFFFGNSLGPLTAGFCSAHFGLESVFYVGTGLLLFNLLWVLVEVRDPRGRSRRKG
ncbi:MAG: MFS transporter [Moorellaceae bacterium]